MLTRTLIIAASFALGGCATTGDFGPVGTQQMKNSDGHVVGYKQMMRNKQTGEVLAQVRLFTPIRNDNGELIGYEEHSNEGAIIRDLDGRRIGVRFNDLRSRSTNMRSKGVTLIFGSLDSRRVVTDETTSGVPRPVASLSAADLGALR